MAGFRAVLFDLDGTLLDTALDFQWIIDEMLSARGHDPVNPSQFRQHVSEGARAMVSAAFSLPTHSAETDRLLDEFLTRYGNNPAARSQLFDGLDQLLSWLDAESIPWGIVTNKPERFSRAILETLDLSARCASLVCPEHVSRVKPDPEPLLRACRELGLEAGDTLYIGDHRRDIEAGQRAGMRTIACGYGYIPDHEDPAEWRSTHLVQDAQALTRLLKSLYLEFRA